MARVYANRRGGTTKEYKQRNLSQRISQTDDEYNEAGGVRAAEKRQHDDGLTSYRSTRTRSSVLANHNSGTIRSNKTPAQIQKQIERIRANAEYLRQRDGIDPDAVSRFSDEGFRHRTMQDRLERAESTYQAYADYKLMGNSNG